MNVILILFNEKFLITCHSHQFKTYPLELEVTQDKAAPLDIGCSTNKVLIT